MIFVVDQETFTLLFFSNLFLVLFEIFSDCIKSMVKIKKPTSVKVANVKRKKLVQQIQLDTTGRPIFPIVLGDITVHSLGEVSSLLLLSFMLSSLHYISCTLLLIILTVLF